MPQPNSDYWVGDKVRAGFPEWTFWPARTKSRVVFDSEVINCSESVTINSLPQSSHHALRPNHCIRSACTSVSDSGGQLPSSEDLHFPCFCLYMCLMQYSRLVVSFSPFPLVMSACFVSASVLPSWSTRSVLICKVWYHQPSKEESALPVEVSNSVIRKQTCHIPAQFQL